MHFVRLAQRGDDEREPVATRGQRLDMRERVAEPPRRPVSFDLQDRDLLQSTMDHRHGEPASIGMPLRAGARGELEILAAEPAHVAGRDIDQPQQCR